MGRNYSTITRYDVHRHVLNRLTAHLRLADHSPRCPAAVVFHVVRAAARLCLVSAAAHRLVGTATDS